MTNTNMFVYVVDDCLFTITFAASSGMNKSKFMYAHTQTHME